MKEYRVAVVQEDNWSKDNLAQVIVVRAHSTSAALAKCMAMHDGLIMLEDDYIKTLEELNESL